MTFTHPEPSGPLLGIALFSSSHVDPDALGAALTEEYGAAVSRHEAESDAHGPVTFAVQEAEATVLVTPVDEPIPSDEALQAAHPIWWTDTSPVRDHLSHVVITTWRPEGAPVDHESVLRAATLFSAVTTLVLERPDAVGVYYGNGGSTVPAQTYAHYVRETLERGDLPTDVWVTAWPMQDEGGRIGGTTLGLRHFGHADLVVLESTREPSEVYFMLQNLAGHLIVSGEQLEPGSTVQFADDTSYEVSAVETPEGLDFLRIAF